MERKISGERERERDREEREINEEKQTKCEKF